MSVRAFSKREPDSLSTLGRKRSRSDASFTVHRHRRRRRLGLRGPHQAAGSRLDPRSVPELDPRPPGATIVLRGQGRFYRRVAVVGFLCVAVGLGLLAGQSDLAMTNRLMSADFQYGADPFLTTDGPTYVSDVVDGNLRMRARSDSSITAYSGARFARETDAVDLSVGVVSVSGPAAFGVACWHSEGREGYAVVASTGGGVSVRRLAPTNFNGDGVDLASDPRATVPLRDASFGLSCDGFGGAYVRVTGYVNGRQVLSAIDAHPFRGFVAGGLLFHGADASAEVRFGCAQAVVTGSAPLARGASLTC